MINTQEGVAKRTGLSSDTIQFKYFFIVLAIFTSTWLSV
jgi:hypothetical protein